jgi:hypothetical protein
MTGRVICKNCRHPRPLHRNGTSACAARGCHAGPDGAPCAGFVAEVEPAAVPLARFQAAADLEGLPAASNQ